MAGLNNYTYDIETFKAIFSCVIKHYETGQYWVYEVSRRRNQSRECLAHLHWLGYNKCNMIGFNNEHFDYVVLHALAQLGYFTERNAYDKAQMIFADDSRFGETIWPRDRSARQIDLYMIHHFDHEIRRTSLKDLEFNMRLPVIAEPPYELVHADYLTDAQLDDVITGNIADVDATEEFYRHSLPFVEFRETINPDWINFNDTKIGKQYFIDTLEAAAPGTCYIKERGKSRQPRQTPRDVIRLREALLPSIKFKTREFQEMHTWLWHQEIYETKGVFKNLIVNFRGLDYKFGLGGMHASVERRLIVENDDWETHDIDVKSFYPDLAVKNRLYPLHLGEGFCDIYEDQFNKRQLVPKEDPKNKMMKYGLNGVYGDSNNDFSPFLDPLYTMAITLNGQLLICMLAETICLYTNAEIIQVNTDGLTARVPKSQRAIFDECCKAWERYTRLTLEYGRYSRMWIRDVNSYMAEKHGGKLKKIGAYDGAPEWHKDHSALVVPRVVEQVLTKGVDPLRTLVNWPDAYDFCIRCKIGRQAELRDSAGNTHGRVTRYHIARQGVTLKKHFASGRSAAVEKDWFVNVCNDMRDYDWSNLELRWYLDEVNKLVIA